MDFVKREDQNLIDEESYKAYADALQKQSQHLDLLDYQHTALSMEQLHQAMQSSLTSSINHNFQIPVSPRQMLMLKNSHLTRNLHFSEIPSHLQRNLTAEIELAQSLANEVGVTQISQNIVRNNHHEDILAQNLVRNLNENGLIRSLANEIELQQNIGVAQNLVQSLNEQIDLSRNLGADVSQNLNRNDMHLTQNLVRQESSIVQNLNHELDLSHHVNRNPNIEHEILEESRRTPIIIQCGQDNILDQNIGQRMTNQSLVTHDVNQRPIEQNDHLLPMPFHIKSEQEDDGYFYDTQGMFQNNINGLSGHIQMNPEPTQAAPTNLHQDNQIYAPYNHIPNMNPALAPIDLYTRPQNYVQNYAMSNVNRENPQNLVVHRQFENHSPYEEEFKRLRQDGVIQNGGKDDSSKHEEPKENLKPGATRGFASLSAKPTENNKMFYTEYSQNFPVYAEKNENDSSENNKIQENKLDPSDDLSMIIKGEYVCYKCNDIFPSKRGLKQHSKSCAENGENNGIQEKVGKFCCSQCPYRCQSPAILKIHERTHTGEKPFSCTFCDYKSGQKNNVAKHILVHMKEKPFRCQYCEYRCAQKNNLVVHERTHTGYKPFACPYCEYRTVQKPNLVKHMYLHTDQKPFSCDQCSYRCVQKTNLTKHKQRHLNEKDGEKITDFKNQAKPYRPRQKSVKCSLCPYRCVQKSSLDKHIQFKHTDIQNHVSNGDFPQENFEQGLNLMKNVEDNVCDETIQNLSVKKDGQIFGSEGLCQEKSLIEPLQIQS